MLKSIEICRAGRTLSDLLFANKELQVTNFKYKVVLYTIFTEDSQ